ncbi:hypothetical protein HWV23_02815 [Natronomonas halophila]|uniref:hypothetical protein n=1 Tax=Natronomonas halophila TaxID=2747817 RepID=UPI0015B6CFCC|nr:hypothetical protein [Natronomonas halophila]QLD84634.1 hypothetical protein HWV23_02540 [Natronomonas halophila]QLD84688.1 hypothetical protein HWV23_02815 [Natronomonas halophila]
MPVRRSIAFIIFCIVFGWMVLARPCDRGGCIDRRTAATGLTSALLWVWMFYITYLFLL